MAQTRQLGSLPLQAALYFNGFYSAALVVLDLLVYIYKGA
jgi:hypothetical protein